MKTNIYVKWMQAQTASRKLVITQQPELTVHGAKGVMSRLMTNTPRPNVGVSGASLDMLQSNFRPYKWIDMCCRG